MKKYTLKVGEVFTQQKANELKEYLEAKDQDIREMVNTLDITHRGYLMDVLDFVERWNKQDEEEIVADSASKLQEMLNRT